MVLSKMNTRHAFELADMIAGGSVESTQMGKASTDAAREARFEDAESGQSSGQGILTGGYPSL